MKLNEVSLCDVQWGRGLIADPGHIDDEYAKVGTYDPKIVITTSRSPSSRLLQFSKVCFPEPFLLRSS